MRSTAVIARPLGRIYDSALQPMQVPSVDLPPVCLIECIWIVLIREPVLLPPSITIASLRSCYLAS